jgi:hypothetical protein
MAFSPYKTARAVVKDFQIVYSEAIFVVENPLPINPYFQENLEEMIRDGVVDNSEYAICENLIAPVLKEVWRSYKQNFLLWSHKSFRYDDRLCGVPDYILAKRAASQIPQGLPLGKIVLDQPYLMIVEAKQDNFDEGWAQCLAAMVAAQRMNDKPQVIFGIVSNGEIWEFGKLDTSQFTKNSIIYPLQNLSRLFAAVNDVFHQCQLQLEKF